CPSVQTTRTREAMAITRLVVDTRISHVSFLIDNASFKHSQDLCRDSRMRYSSRPSPAEVSTPHVGWAQDQQPALDRPSVGQEQLCSWQVDADHSDVIIAQFLGSSQFINPHLERWDVSRVKRAQKRPRILALFIFLYRPLSQRVGHEVKGVA